jgi:hypothetical protein
MITNNRKKSILVLDTETADLSGSVYDIGYTITDKKGRIYQERQWLVDEVFTDAGRMMGAFYAQKLFSHYAPMLQAGTIRLTPWMGIIGTLRNDMVEHGVNVLAAYNLPFDRRVLQSTHTMLGHTDKILPHAVDLLDLWQFACQTKLNTRLYKDLAKAQGWISEAGNIRTGAEYAYRFCRGDWGFIEDHTALSDARIETEIMAACFTTKKAVPYNVLNGKTWRIVNA